jgi:hypothetical protein
VKFPVVENVPEPPVFEKAGAPAGFVHLMEVAPGQLAVSVELWPL